MRHSQTLKVNQIHTLKVPKSPFNQIHNDTWYGRLYFPKKIAKAWPILHTLLHREWPTYQELWVYAFIPLNLSQSWDYFDLQNIVKMKVLPIPSTILNWLVSFWFLPSSQVVPQRGPQTEEPSPLANCLTELSQEPGPTCQPPKLRQFGNRSPVPIKPYQ